MALQNFVARRLPTISAVWLNRVDVFLETFFANNRSPAEISTGAVVTNFSYQERDIRRYGASTAVTTQSTNRVAIQTAIEVAAALNGANVYIPPGIWNVDAALSMRNNVRMVGEGIGSTIRIRNGATFNDNIIKFEAISGASVENIGLDGNRANSGGGTRYGIYFGGAANCRVLNCFVHELPGDGIQLYNSDRVQCCGNHTYGNVFHGIELEQLTNSLCTNNVSYGNDRHGFFIFQGEIGATGSKGLTVSMNVAVNNTQSGIVVQGELTEDVTFVGNIIRSNVERGMMVFDQVAGAVIVGNVIALNGQFGIYGFRMFEGIVSLNRFHNNGISVNGGFIDYLMEGDGTKFAISNVVIGNNHRINAANKVSYAIKENSANDGPNIVVANMAPYVSTAGNPIAVVNDTPGAFLQSSMQMCKINYGRVNDNWNTATFSGNPPQVAFAIPHFLSPDEPSSANVTAGSPDARGDFSIATNPSTILVTFAVAPVAGVGNVILRWRAER